MMARTLGMRGPFREMNAQERELVSRLLEVNFPGRDEIAQQLKVAKVRAADADGCIQFYVEGDMKAPVVQTVPVEAEAEDEDGMDIHALLHVNEGKIKELEFFKGDSSPIKRMPPASAWRVY